ncbi:MAG: hypothetical protein SYR96_17525 [Actinomycetota bacterium]|nr:hypothetical protein [Actinomycetota bacterium]
MRVTKASVVSVLQSRGLAARADWVERTLPEIVDTSENHSLLSTLGVDPATLPSAEGPPQHRCATSAATGARSTRG